MAGLLNRSSCSPVTVCGYSPSRSQMRRQRHPRQQCVPAGPTWLAREPCGCRFLGHDLAYFKKLRGRVEANAASAGTDPGGSRSPTARHAACSGWDGGSRTRPVGRRVAVGLLPLVPAVGHSSHRRSGGFAAANRVSANPRQVRRPAPPDRCARPVSPASWVALHGEAGPAGPRGFCGDAAGTRSRSPARNKTMTDLPKQSGHPRGRPARKVPDRTRPISTADK